MATRHESITLERVNATYERSQRTLDSPGFCLACGAEAEDVEPDASKYVCTTCGAGDVYGVESVLLMMI